MKKAIITLLLVLIACTPVQAAEWFSWDETNTNLHVPYTLLFLADLRQTLEIAKAPNHYHEKDSGTNWYLGSQPDKSRVYEYFAFSYLVNTVLIYALPDKWSHTVHVGMVIERANVVYKNYHLGIRISF